MHSTSLDHSGVDLQLAVNRFDPGSPVFGIFAALVYSISNKVGKKIRQLGPPRKQCRICTTVTKFDVHRKANQ